MNIPVGSDVPLAPWNEKESRHDKPKQEIHRCPVHGTVMSESTYWWECDVEDCFEVIEKPMQEE